MGGLMIRTASISLFLFVIGCSTVETSGGGLSVATMQPNERIQLNVQTGNAQMDKILYEIAYQQFSEVMPIREIGPYTGVLEITFSSSTQGAFLGSSNTVSSGTATTSGWYTGSGYTGNASGHTQSSTVTTGTVFEWQNSTMIAVLKRSDGERLWSADYSYKGGWEMSGWSVNTPQEAARLVTKRLKARYITDTKK